MTRFPHKRFPCYFFVHFNIYPQTLKARIDISNPHPTLTLACQCQLAMGWDALAQHFRFSWKNKELQGGSYIQPSR